MCVTPACAQVSARLSLFTPHPAIGSSINNFCAFYAANRSLFWSLLPSEVSNRRYWSDKSGSCSLESLEKPWRQAADTSSSKWRAGSKIAPQYSFSVEPTVTLVGFYPCNQLHHLLNSIKSSRGVYGTERSDSFWRLKTSMALNDLNTQPWTENPMNKTQRPNRDMHSKLNKKLKTNSSTYAVLFEKILLLLSKIDYKAANSNFSALFNCVVLIDRKK